MNPSTWLLIGFVTYTATAALGTSAQLGLVNTRPFRWAHHALFAAVWVTLVAVIIAAWGAAWFPLLVPIAVCMALIPRFRAGTRPHCTAALIGFGSYVGALFLAMWRG
jgi:hypothetical protein